jgi:hypothetical protein
MRAASSHQKSRSTAPASGREASDEGDRDRQPDEKHHPRLAIPGLVHGPLEERPTAVDEDHRSEYGWYQRASRERWGAVAEHVLEGSAEEHDRQGEGQRDPEAVPEHRRIVVSVIICVRAWIRPGVVGMGHSRGTVALIHGHRLIPPRVFTIPPQGI